MVTTETVKLYIDRLCREIGTTAAAIHNPKTGAWYFSIGHSTIEVFLTSVGTDEGTLRTFLRCFAPLRVVPPDNLNKTDFFYGALEANTRYTGIKLGVIAGRGLLCAIAECDIASMSYADMVMLITDTGHSAGQLDDFLQQRFSR
ncbi:MAG: hypothetical protein ABW019_03830 [Chitinophagaceae bacterium]